MAPPKSELSRRHWSEPDGERPFVEAEVGGDDDAVALIELAEQMEEQRPARGAEWQIAQFIQDHEIEAGQAFGNLPGLCGGLYVTRPLWGGPERERLVPEQRTTRPMLTCSGTNTPPVR